MSNNETVVLPLPPITEEKSIHLNMPRSVVICSFPLWKHSPNGSLKVFHTFLQKQKIDEAPWIMVVLKNLEFDFNDPQRCNDKCIQNYKNLKQTFYLENYEDIQFLGELISHLKKWLPTPFQLFSLDADAGVCGNFLKNTMNVKKWTHLCTLHLTKNVKALTDRNILSGEDLVMYNGVKLSPLYLKKEKAPAEQADEYIVVSKSELDWACQVLGRTGPTSIYFPDASWWRNENLISLRPPKDLFYIRERYPNKLLLLFIGRITYQKGIHFLLQAKYPENVHLCIMSSSQYGDGNLINACRQFETNHPHSCSWIGPYYGQDKFDIMKQCDGVICCSLYEPWNLVGMETILFTDTLLISSAVDGMQEYLTPEGFINCGTTMESVQSAIDQFATSTTLGRKMMAANAKKYCQPLFNTVNASL